MEPTMTTTAVTHTEAEVAATVLRQAVVTTVAMGSRRLAVVVVAAIIPQAIRKVVTVTIHHLAVTSWHGLSRLQPTMAHRPMVVNTRRIPAMATVRHHPATGRQCTVTGCPHPTRVMAHHHLVMGRRLAAATEEDARIPPGGKGVNGDRA